MIFYFGLVIRFYGERYRGPMSALIKIYGERNTNTNYMSKLIELNLDAQEVPGTVPVSIIKIQKMLQKIFPDNEQVRDIYFYLTYGRNLGWKHTAVKPVEVLKKYDIVKSKLAFLTITKNPYSWLLSLYRRPYQQYYQQEPSFEEFLHLPWKTVARDNSGRLLKNPMELWNIKNSSYLSLTELNALNITTESIFEDPSAVMHKISSELSIGKVSENFINYERSTKDVTKDGDYYRDYYINEKWRNNLSSEAIAIINEAIDKKLMAHYGYNVLS